MKMNPAKLLLEFQKLPKIKKDRTFLEISGYPHYENVWSNILQFFLNPNNEHGFQDLVLNALVKCIEPDFTCDYERENVSVEREFPTIKNNRIDLVIQTEKYVIGIENKIFHFLNNDLNDYSQTVSSLCRANSKKAITFVLSLKSLTNQQDREKIKESGFKNVTYIDLFENIKKNWGDFISTANPKYDILLKDFIKSIQNLTSRTMENKELWGFFKENAEDIEYLTSGFLDYRNFLFQKVYPLMDMLPQNEYAPNCIKQWVYKGEGGEVASCLVHDYLIDNNYRISIDSNIGIGGWDITLFGRDRNSSNSLFSTMCQSIGFLPKPFDQYAVDERLIYQLFDSDVDIELVAESLKELLARVVKYKAQIENTAKPTL